MDSCIGAPVMVLKATDPYIYIYNIYNNIIYVYIYIKYRSDLSSIAQRLFSRRLLNAVNACCGVVRYLLLLLLLLLLYLHPTLTHTFYCYYCKIVVLLLFIVY